jgi:hypothetical protein
MIFSIENKGNIIYPLRSLGYRFQREDGEKREKAFLRILSPSGYPRFHLFAKQKEGKVEFSLHLDQKKPVYSSSPAHNADYQGELLEKEAERIKKELGA